MTVTDELTTRLPRDLRDAAQTLGREEVGFLVETYYSMQKYRMTHSNRMRDLVKGDEPHATVAFFADQFYTVERQIKSALTSYADDSPLGAWAQQMRGIGPVLAAGLLAHVEITEGKTIGKVWAHAGLVPGQEWKKGAKRPWNARLKTHCWKIGESFTKMSGFEDAFYGHKYLERKAYEVARNEHGEHVELCKQELESRGKRMTPEQRAHYEGGKLPPGRIHLRAQRWAVKLFLSHYFEAGYRLEFGEQPPAIYALTHLEHTDYIPPPIPWP